MNIEHFPEKKVFQTVVDGETARLMYHVADGGRGYPRVQSYR